MSARHPHGFKRGLMLAAVGTVMFVVACDNVRPPRTAYRAKPAIAADESPVTSAAPSAEAVQTAAKFSPPSFDDIPKGEFGDMVRLGRQIFLDTPTHAPQYVGNGLSCGNCHLDAGRLADSAPLWGAFVRYPAYRAKTGEVNNYLERLQGCFMYSMNGKAPPADSRELKALEVYSYWMSQGVPVGAKMQGAGYPKDFKPPKEPDYARGETVYAANCALCHGPDGLGQQVDGRYVFPPLWGPDSYNWGAGMHQLDNAAAFIKANMPLGRGDTLSDQEAWDVAKYINAHERPQDPRYTGNLAETRKRFHDSPHSLYGLEVEGRVLGANPAQ